MKPTYLVGAVVLAAYLWLRRRRTETVFQVLGGVAVVVAVVYGLGAFEVPDLEKLLEDLGRTLGPWTYLLVGVLAFAETGAFIGLIAPGETTIIVGGVVAGQGEINIEALIALVWACAVAGDLVSYYLGRRLGREFLEQHGTKVAITPERLVKVETFFEKYGGRSILIGRFVGLVRAIAPFLAGSSGMPLKRFVPYDVIGAGLWGTTYCLLGYVFWQSFGAVLDAAKTGSLVLATLIVIIVAIVALVRYLRVPEHRDEVRGFVARQEQLPVLGPVLRVAIRLGRRPARFAVGRLTPGDLGLEVTTLAAVGVVGAFVLVGYAVNLGPNELTPGDVRVMHWIEDVRTGWLTDAARVLTYAGYGPLTLAAVLLACAALAAKRQLLEAAALGSGYALTQLVERVVRGAVDRARPLGGLVETSTASFPSGHVANSVLWVAIAVAVARVLPRWSARAGVVIASVLAVLVVAFTRLELRVHYFSDVAGGAGVGAACFAACGIAALLVARMRHSTA